jgi:hypothetical protein
VRGLPSSVTDDTVEVTASLDAPVSGTTVHSFTVATNQYWAPTEPDARFFRLRIP